MQGKRTKSILIQLDRMPGIVQSKMIDNNGDTLQWHIMAGKVLWVLLLCKSAESRLQHNFNAILQSSMGTA